jgi:hypothetical protein
MLTVYGVTLITGRLTEELHERDTRESVGYLLEPWLERAWPHAERTNTTQVTWVNSVTDKVFRCEISERHPSSDGRQATIVSMLTTRRGELCVDIRRELHPIGLAILPRTPYERPSQALTDIVCDVAIELRLRDANQLVSGSLIRVSSAEEGAGVAAFVEAPSRRLPIVIDCTPSKGGSPRTTSETARALTGIAHVYQLSTAAAENGFNQQFGRRGASSSWVLVAWPKVGSNAQTAEYTQTDDERLVADLIAAAVGALPILPRPTTRSQSTPVAAVQHVVTNTLSPEVGKLQREKQELEQQISELKAENEDLRYNLTTTDHLSAQAVEERNRCRDQLTAVLTLRDDPTQWNNTSHVLSLARQSFTVLEFHPGLDVRLGSTQFSLATNRRIYDSLLELNNLAARLGRGDIEVHLFNTYCNDRFNFAPSIGENASQKFGSEYTIMRNGKAFMLGPHIRCNDARIYFFVDTDEQRVVVGHVGRHLRDQSTR